MPGLAQDTGVARGGYKHIIGTLEMNGPPRDKESEIQEEIDQKQNIRHNKSTTEPKSKDTLI